ncbi:MAG: hypothetical protein ABMB14_37065, partial [Myxococcota bacterium]
LGAALAWLGGRGYGIVAAWAVGGITGVVGAAAVAGVNLVAGTPTLAVVSGAVNELLFPIGCATILVASTWLARLTAAAAGAPTPAVAEDAR